MISVMLVDDSAAIRGLLGRIIDREPDMRVIASAPDGVTALEILRERAPDVVILDVEMPEMDGLTALPRILQERPATRVIMASALTTRGADVTMRALALGASDYIAKPSAVSAVRSVEAISRELLAKVRALGAPAPVERLASPPIPDADDPFSEEPAPARVLCIASSTGGPNALATVLKGLPEDFPLPILIAQHMPALFTASLAERLQRETGRPCREARHLEPVVDGHVLIAPGDYHMRIGDAAGRTVVLLDQSPPVNFCRPAADLLLESAARIFGSAAVALVLTGMGEDGRRGCAAIAARGGRVITQDRASSVVWGMPGAVTNAGLANAVLPLDGIAAHLVALCSARV